MKDVFCGGCQKFNSAWISNKETIKCREGKFIIESFYFLCSEKKAVFYYRSVHLTQDLTGQMALLRLSAKV